MATKLEKLFFAIGVQDDGASSKVAKLQASIKNMAKGAGEHIKGIGVAAMGVAGAVLSIKQIIGPAVELNRALAEVGALGVDDSDLAKLQKAAGRFAFEYGGAATDVVRSSYDIQSAIAGLSGDELAAFTTAGGVLAKAVKSEVGTITNYMGTMYGIFEDQAARMGKAAWVDQLAGRTAYAVQVFKTSGDGMSAAFTSLGANAKAAGIEAAEQMAVLGMLQATMGGSEAGSKYKAYLRGLGQAQKVLGLKFTDSEGKMLGMVDVLEKIRGKFGDTLTVAQADQLKKAFGSDEASALINLMLKQTGSLKKNIEDIGKIKGMEHAQRMAKKQTDAFERFGAAVNYVQANFMQKLTPTLERWTDKATKHLDTINKWITKYPNVARVVGYVVLGVLALSGVVALLTAAFHLVALLASPVILAFLLIAAAIVLCVTYWKDLRAYFQDVSWGEPFLWIMDRFEEKWSAFTDLITDFSWIKLIKFGFSNQLLLVEAAINALGKLADALGMDIGKSLRNWRASDAIGGALSVIGLEEGKPQGPKGPRVLTRTGLPKGVGQIELAPENAPQVQSLKRPKLLQAPQGGILGSSLTRVSNSGKSITIGEQHIHVETPQQIPDEMFAMSFG